MQKSPGRRPCSHAPGGKGEEFLLVGFINTDGKTNIALLIVALDHNTYIRPVAVLLHAGIVLSINIIRDFIQHSVQKGIPPV